VWWCMAVYRWCCWDVCLITLTVEICAVLDVLCEQQEVAGKNRSVMPLDVLGRARVTMCFFCYCKSLKRNTNWGPRDAIARANEEFLVGAFHQAASITSLPFVHTARRFYRLW